MRNAAVVLAAGASTRLGRPKQLLVLDGETLLERAVRIASQVCQHVVVVLGAQAELVQRGCHLREAQVVRNEDWREGMASSIRSGAGAIKGFDGALIMTCDMPAVTGHHLQKLVEGEAISASFYGGKRGVPAFFPASCFPKLFSLEGEGGAQSLLKEARAVALVSGEIDIDTMEDFELAKASWPSGTA